MPYVSNNYRFEEKSKIKSLMDAFFFVAFSSIAILVILFVLGWASSGQVQAQGIESKAQARQTQ